MFQQLGDKCIEYAFPVAVGGAIWFGVNYFELAERITKVDVTRYYSDVQHDFPVSRRAQSCVIENAAPTLINIGKFDAALYTASFKNISAPYFKKLAEAEQIINANCGINLARAEAEEKRIRAEQMALLEEQKRIAIEAEKQALALREEAAQRTREAIRLAEEAQKRAQEELTRKHLETLENMTGIPFGAFL